MQQRSLLGHQRLELISHQTLGSILSQGTQITKTCGKRYGLSKSRSTQRSTLIIEVNSCFKSMTRNSLRWNVIPYTKRFRRKSWRRGKNRSPKNSSNTQPPYTTRSPRTKPWPLRAVPLIDAHERGRYFSLNLKSDALVIVSTTNQVLYNWLMIITTMVKWFCLKRYLYN